MQPSSPSILVLDDDPIFQILVTTLLRQRLGVGVVSATTVDEALSILRKEVGVRLIISDLNLPDVDGIEFVSQLVRIGRAPPLLFVSGATPAVLQSAAPFAMAHGLSVIGTLIKPIDHDEFVRIVGDAINRRPRLPTRPTAGLRVG